MNDITFEALKLVVMACTVLVVRYLIPWLKLRLDADKVNTVKEWVYSAVLMAQQVYATESGSRRKEIVVQFLQDVLIANNIKISDLQLDALIESAVKQMKISEGR